MSDKLTDKQTLFISEYLLSFNATQAAIRAGYSEKSAALIGSENIRKPYIKKHIQERLNEMLEDDTLALKNQIIQKLKDLSFTDNEDTNNRDSLKAVELLGKYAGLWVEKVEHSGDLDINIKVKYD